MLIKKSLNLPFTLTKILRSKAGIWFPEYDHLINPSNNVLAILGRPAGKLIIPACNIVTNDGDLFYAELSVEDTPTDTFTWWEMQSAGTPDKAADRSDFTAIADSGKAQTAGYPKLDDADTDNTGAGADVRTTSVSYTAGDFDHSAITHGIVTNTTPGADENILSGWAWASSINKTSADTLKCFLNHTFNGV
jgi:hypothetical protein